MLRQLALNWEKPAHAAERQANWRLSLMAVNVSAAIAMGGCIGSAHSASAAAWKIGHNQGLCFTAKEVDGRAFSLSLMRFPTGKDAGRMELGFEDPSFELPTAEMTPVVLAFDSGTIDQYYIKKMPEGHFRVLMTTYALKNILSVMAKASSLEVTAVGGRSTSFNLAGFGETIPALRDCAEKQM